MGQSESREQEDPDADQILLRFMLMRKTGHGKSATGNFLLNRYTFKTSSKMTSETKKVRSGFASFKNFILKVVDGPGLEDTDANIVRDVATATKNMDKALAMCSTGVDAFLFVIKFGVRFTAGEVYVLETLKRIFGDKYYNHVIVVITYGDLFQTAMKEDNSSISFDKWCRQQKGAFSQLFKSCSERVVLVNNIEKNEEQRNAQLQQIVDLAYILQTRHGRYTSRCFEIAQAEREKLILENKELVLREEMQEKIGLLFDDIEKLPKQPSVFSRRRVLKRVQALKHEIGIQDKGFGLLVDVLNLVQDIENNLHDTFEIQRLAKKMEKIRKANPLWELIGSISTFYDDVITLIYDSVTAVAAVTAHSVMRIFT